MKTDAVFWDASAFVALGYDRDRYHAQAEAIREHLAQQGVLLLTTDAVLTEVANAFSSVRARPVAIHTINTVLDASSQSASVVIHICAELWYRGWQLYTQRSDKDWSLTDCISFIVMEDHGVRRAFAFDRHFEQAGFQLLATPA